MKFHKIDAQGQILVQRVTSAQRGVATPSIGRILYDTDLSKMYYGDGSGWNEFGSGGSGGSQKSPLDLRYIDITGTSDEGGLLTKTQSGVGTTTATYNIANFTGATGFSSSAIRGIYIRCKTRKLGGGSDYAKVTCTYPDATVKTICQASNNGNSGIELIICVPISKDQTSISLELISSSGGSYSIYEILGCSQLYGSNFGLNFTVGTVVPFAGSTPPSDWLICDGTLLNRVSYSALYAILGLNYNRDDDGTPLPDDGTTFKIPDLRGRFSVSANPAGPSGTTRVPNLTSSGLIDGEYEHQLTEPEMAVHTHGVGRSDTSGGDNCANDGPGTNRYTSYTGGDQPHNNIPPYLVTNYIIKT